MFTFAQGHLYFQRAGLVLLMVQLCLFVFGLPPFHVGIWLQTEPDMVAMFTLGLGNAIWLLYGCVTRALVPQRATPIFYVLMAWVLWQVVATGFSFLPFRSWFGPVEMGEGAAWHLCLLLVTMLAYPLWQVRSFRIILLVWAAGVISTESLLHVIFNARNNHYVAGLWIPAQWAAYLAFMVGYFWIAVMAGNYVRGPGAYLALIAFAADVVIISHNKTSIALMPFTIMVSLGVFFMQRRRSDFAVPGRRLRMAAVVVALLPISWLVFSTLYTAPPEEPVQYDAQGQPLPTPDTFLLNLSHKDSALGSRVGLIQIGVEAMRHEPRRWLVGNGWGEYNDSMFRYALLPGVHMFKDGLRAPNWGFVDGNAYHSHSQPLEALLALGLPGMILWFALPITILLTIPARLFWSCGPMLLMLHTVSFFWFQLPQCVPINGLMLAALCSVCPRSEKRRPVRRGVAISGFALATVVMALTAMEQNVTMHYGERLYKGSRYLPVEQYPMNWLLTDLYRGGDHLRVASMGFGLSLDKEKGDVDERQRAWYQRFMEAGHVMQESPLIGPRGHYMELWLQYKLLLNLGFPIFADLGHQATEAMPQSVLAMVKAAPLRDDLATFYLLNLEDVTHKDVKAQVKSLRDILEAAPNHRPALWVLGHMLLKKPATKEEGEAMIRKAVALHVEDVYAITQAELKPWVAK